MKATIYDIAGKKGSEITLPAVFNTKIREDIALKNYESEKTYAPPSPSKYAGRKHSASGTISHRRHEWKGHYGKGVSRVPRKAMWRRGEQFYWVGAEINAARGGRAVHTPEVYSKPIKINLKEKSIGLNSAIASTANKDFVSRRYERLKNFSGEIPFIVTNLNNLKTKQLIEFLKKILGDKYKVALKQKEVRSGKGKMRNRKYKESAGMLIVKSSNEKIALKGVDIVSANQLRVSDLYPLGRITLYTQQSLEELK